MNKDIIGENIITDISDNDNITEEERLVFIKRCDKLENMINNFKGDGNIKIEKKKYLNALRNMVNDLTFTNKLHFRKLNNMLIELYKDSKKQSGSPDDGEKEDLVNMMVHRMIYDTSKKALKNKDSVSILNLEEGTEGEQLLEKYIIKLLKKHLDKEMCRMNKEFDDKNEEIVRRLDLLEHSVSKLGSMESLYEKVHSKNSIQRRRIISLIEDPIKKYSEPLTKPYAKMTIVSE
jgi:hypothetical protein